MSFAQLTSQPAQQTDGSRDQTESDAGREDEPGGMAGKLCTATGQGAADPSGDPQA